MFKKCTQISMFPKILRLKNKLKVQPRILFIALSVFLSLCLLFVLFLPSYWQVRAVFIIPALCFVSTKLVLGSVSILPSAFTLGLVLTLLYFPNFSVFFRTMLLLSFCFGFYVSLLSENIFNVAREKSIPLLRPAQTVSFLLTLFTAFLFFTALYKLYLHPLLIPATVGVISFFLAYQNLQSINLPKTFSKSIQFPCLLLAVVVGEVALCISFVSIESFFRALVISTAFYVSLGVTQQWLQHTLRVRTMRDYVGVAAVVGIITMLFG